MSTVGEVAGENGTNVAGDDNRWLPYHPITVCERTHSFRTFLCRAATGA